MTYTRQKPELPGTQASHSERNAQGHLDGIVAAKALASLAQQSVADIDFTDCDAEMRCLITNELCWNVGDGRLALDDALQQWCCDKPLAVERFAKASHWRQDWQLTHFEVLFSTGGPALKLWFDPYDSEVRLMHQDWCTPWKELPLTAEEVEALQWYGAVLGLESLSGLRRRTAPAKAGVSLCLQWI